MVEKSGRTMKKREKWEKKTDTKKPEEWLKKRLGAAMKAAQKFPKKKAVYSNESCTGKVPAMKAGQKRL